MITPEKQKEYQENFRRNRDSKRDWINKRYKIGKPCADCGKSFHHCAMDFHHRVGTNKIATICQLMHKSRLQNVIDEIEKCDLLCAVCHRVRHYKKIMGE